MPKHCAIKALLFLSILTLVGQANVTPTGAFSNIEQWSKKQNQRKISQTIVTLEKKAIQNATKWLNNLTIDIEQIAAKGYGDKKRLSEALGTYWMIHKYSNKSTQASIEKRVTSLYEYTRKPQYLNLLSQNDALFKKNSMSYLRIMWLLREMNFDISHLKTQFKKLKPRMDSHLKARGPWQKSMFAHYYDMFGFTKPTSIVNTQNMTGLIGEERPLKKYKRMHAYMLTHQVFVAFDYGHKKIQTRFNEKELKYLRSKLPLIVKHYQAKRNWDLVAELLSCMIYLDLTQHKYFQSAYEALIYAQNDNGSWGDYERLRPKYGKNTEIKYYLHTTGVALATLLEKQNWKKK